MQLQRSTLLTKMQCTTTYATTTTNKIKAVEIQICRRLTEVPIQSHLHNSPKNCPTTKLSKNTPQKTTSNTRQTGRTTSAFI